jgi:hypothetical protein
VKRYALVAVGGAALVVLAALRALMDVGEAPRTIALGAAGAALLGLGIFFGRLTAEGRRVAGAMCVGCGRKILFEHEGEFCDACGASAHGACLNEHRGRAHKNETGPFR